MASRLPPELWHDIFILVEDLKSFRSRLNLAHLCLVSRAFEAIARPLLYKTVFIPFDTELSTEEPDWNRVPFDIFGSLLKEVVIFAKLPRGRPDNEDAQHIISSQEAYTIAQKGWHQRLKLLRSCPNICKAFFRIQESDVYDFSLPTDEDTLVLLEEELLGLPCTTALQHLTLALPNYRRIRDMSYVLDAFAQLIASTPSLATLELENISDLQQVLQPLANRLTSDHERIVLDTLILDLTTAEDEETRTFRDTMISCLRDLPSIKHLRLRLTDIRQSFWSGPLPEQYQPNQSIRIIALDVDSFPANTRMAFLANFFPALNQLSINLCSIHEFPTYPGSGASVLPHLSTLSVTLRLRMLTSKYQPNEFDKIVQQLLPLFDRSILPALQTFRMDVKIQHSKDHLVKPLTTHLLEWANAVLSGVQGRIVVNSPDRRAALLIEKEGGWVVQVI